jgi:hypothetical protein
VAGVVIGGLQFFCSESLRSRVLVALSAGNVVAAIEAQLWCGVSGVNRAAVASG